MLSFVVVTAFPLVRADDDSENAIHNLLSNSGFEEQGASEERAQQWEPYGSGYLRECGEGDNAGCAIRLLNAREKDQSGAYQRIDLNQDEITPVFVGARVCGEEIVVADGTTIGASVYAKIGLKDGAVVYMHSAANSGTFCGREVGFNTRTNALVNQPIQYIEVYAILAYARGSVWFDDMRAVEVRPRQPAVTIGVDDGEDSMYVEIAPVLKDFGFVSSMAIVTSYIGQEGHMTLDEIRELYDRGHEVMSHGQHHKDLTVLSPAEQMEEVCGSEQILTNYGFAINNFAFPFGAYNGALLDIANECYVSARGVEDGNNPQGVFRFDIKTRGVVATTTPEDVAGWLDRAREHNEWVVLIFHDIAETGDDEYYTTPARLQEIFEVIRESGVQVVTYNEGIELFAMPRADE